MIISYPITGNNRIEIIRYTLLEQNSNQGLIWINQTQYFKGVPFQIWNFSLGGYRICQKWLNERVGHSLSDQEIQNYQNIIVIVKEIADIVLEMNTAIQYSQFKNQKIFEKIRFIISEQLGIEYKQISLASNFTTNLGADSLDMLELFMVLEKVFGISTNEKVINNISTVQQLVKYISQGTSPSCVAKMGCVAKMKDAG
ncbi:acyl carrier protein [Mastigocoleus testarum]|uniref:Acyl carrier protein n=1 Tax=Mastigocoleus testarum BC008 TaxID=371196 RepID=A0A0V8A0V5_9CYAN|nr:acyl carrier protein [Mastigocoleus testarum]KST70382.1 hypothetical protein BC008_45115 [Mastigocoleus testarum BC008]